MAFMLLQCYEQLLGLSMERKLYNPGPCSRNSHVAGQRTKGQSASPISSELQASQPHLCHLQNYGTHYYNLQRYTANILTDTTSLVHCNMHGYRAN